MPSLRHMGRPRAALSRTLAFRWTQQREREDHAPRIRQVCERCTYRFKSAIKVPCPECGGPTMAVGMVEGH